MNHYAAAYPAEGHKQCSMVLVSECLYAKAV